jgi:peptide/nickel transport system substrate-binding protein
MQQEGQMGSRISAIAALAMTTIGATIGATMGAALGVPCVANAQDAPVRGGIVRTMESGYRTLNPAVQSGAATAMPGSQIFAGLIQIGANFEPKPYLAESWTFAADQKSVTFKLVAGTTFHDGKPVTSADVAYSLGVVQKNHPFGPIMLGTMAGVDTPDDLTVVIRLTRPTPHLMQALQPFLMPVLPKHIYDDGQDIKTHPRNMQNVVGSGPFKVVEHVQGQHLILERFDGFVRKGRPYLDRLIISTQKDVASRVISFEKGELDYVPYSGFTERDVIRLRKNDKLTVTEDGYEAVGHINYLELNLRREPFKNVKVRQAMAHAIDKDFIVKSLFLESPKAAHSILHVTNPFFTADVPKFTGGIEKANALLDEAGLKPDANGVRFKMQLEVPNWLPTHLGVMAEYIKPQFKKIGIEVSLRKAPDFATWSQRVSSWDYDASMNAIFNYPDPVIGVHRLFSCKNIRNQIWTNTQAYCNERVDTLMDKAAAEVDPAERKKQYAEFQQILAEDQAMIYLTHMQYSTAQHKYVRGEPKGPWGSLNPWDEMYFDKK